MDKKSKKRLQVTRQKLDKAEQRLAAAKAQPDEPGEAEAIEQEIKSLKAEIEKLKNA